MALFRVPLTLTYPIHLLQPVWQCAPMPASLVTSARPPQRNGPSRLLPCLQLTPSAHALPAGRGGLLSHLPKLSSSRLHVAGIAPTRAQVTSPAARAGCRALLGEGAGAPPHPGAGRPHLARAADAAAPPPQGPHSPRRRMLGEPAGCRAILPTPRAPGRRTPAGARRPVSCLPLTNKAIWQAGGCRVPQATCEGADLKGARPGTLSRGSTAGGPTRTSLSASGPLPGHECCAVRICGPQAPRRTLRRQQCCGQAPHLARPHAARARTPHDPAVTGPAAGGRCLGKASLLLGQMDSLDGAGTFATQRHRGRSRAGRRIVADARGVRGPGAQL